MAPCGTPFKAPFWVKKRLETETTTRNRLQELPAAVARYLKMHVFFNSIFSSVNSVIDFQFCKRLIRVLIMNFKARIDMRWKVDLLPTLSMLSLCKTLKNQHSNYEFLCQVSVLHSFWPGPFTSLINRFLLTKSLVGFQNERVKKLLKMPK